MSASAYSSVPPVIRVKDPGGSPVVFNLDHIVCVDTNAQNQGHANVRLVTGDYVTIAMTVAAFWEML